MIHSLKDRNIFLVVFIGGLLCLFSTQTFAQSKTWVGTTDADWHNPNNWSPSGVPSSSASVTIEPNGGNPFPVISNSDVTVADIQISNYSGGQLTVNNNQTLTITNGLEIISGGTLFIESGGTVHLSGGAFSMDYSNTLIDISTGSFISDVDVTIKGNGLNAGSGTVTFNGNFNLPTSKVFNTETADVTIAGVSEINGTYNGDDGDTVFDNDVEVRSGGVINLDTGTITFNGQGYVRSNGTLNMGSGTVNVNTNLTAESNGNIHVDDGTLNVQGNANFQSNGNLSIDTGTVNVTGDASLESGGDFDLNTGSFNVGGDASFTNGGTVNAGGSDMNLEGDITVQSGGDFNADTSTVVFSGDSTQTINTNGNDLNFYDVVVDSGSTLQTDGSSENTITIENDLTIEEDGTLIVNDDDNIDVQGDLNNNGTIDSGDPFVYEITTPSLTEVLVAYDQKMDPTTSTNTSNYSINKGISITNATLNASDSTVTLTVTPQLTENTEYTLTINDVESADGEKISQDHVKRFTVLIDITYYSRTTGQWDAPNSWSTDSHTGPAASSIPNAQNGEKAIIGNNHTITLGSTQDISNLEQLVINSTGNFHIASGDTLITKNFVVEGDGTFALQNGGTLQIGASDGITAVGNNKGNIQTGTRQFNNAANYIYDGNSLQHTGSGLPQNINDLRINNSSGVIATGNIQTNGTLYLENGTLTIPSGQGIIANTKSIQSGNLKFTRILSGSRGWRMLSSPVATNYNNLLDGLITQGYNGAHYDASTAPYDTLQPNVLYYDETHQGTDNQRWRVPSSASTSVPSGLGHNVYLFGDVFGDSRYNDTLPDTISVVGQENEGTGNKVNLNITHTAAADTGWNLVGNPYGASIDWDNSSGWTKTNVDQTIYVWDANSSSYKTWNGTTGSLGNGLIPPFQAFWIKANADNPELTVTQDAKTFGGNFVGKVPGSAPPTIEIALQRNGTKNSIHFSFHENARVGKDQLDGYYLQPPPEIGTYSKLFSIGRNHKQFSINALPLNFGVPIEIPISAAVFKKGQKVSKTVSLNIAEVKELPYSWSVTLIDRKTGKEIPPQKGFTYQFRTPGAPAKANTADEQILEKEYHIIGESDPAKARFALRIDPGTAASGLPKKIDLKQNYPNPFNPETTIRFTLPIQNKATLEIYDILGRKVATIFNDKSFQAGLHSINWDASKVASGTYIYRLIVEDRVITKKMTLIK
ncbi:T9SS type A sorting domain-containing protein [Fodinibius halophilus]|uniref:T9SS type A sorting domain-containing protein n=1 Tax=Fodinibius halophilus TaxID=1736908 RepID=A0A6M1T1E9_9BACT|nr:T9SS type A sorting domain-containing protein [Fodinibius halophilus]NGP87817.1 T9SS type A sorting domain-containing protein [Fodinibius halophilus]